MDFKNDNELNPLLILGSYIKNADQHKNMEPVRSDHPQMNRPKGLRAAINRQNFMQPTPSAIKEILEKNSKYINEELKSMMANTNHISAIEKSARINTVYKNISKKYKVKTWNDAEDQLKLYNALSFNSEMQKQQPDIKLDILFMAENININATRFDILCKLIRLIMINKKFKHLKLYVPLYDKKVRQFWTDFENAVLYTQISAFKTGLKKNEIYTEKKLSISNPAVTTNAILKDFNDFFRTHIDPNYKREELQCLRRVPRIVQEVVVTR